MKFNITIFGLAFCAVSTILNGDITVLNNSNMPVHVDYDVPIYSHAKTQINPIKSQQDLQDLLYQAILSNSTEEIMQVVNAGGDVNLFINGKAPLMWATVFKKYNSVEVLKRCGAILPCPKNMLYRAILNDSPEDIEHAIQAGADLKDCYINKEGLSPLGWAVMLTKHQAARALLESGAKVINLGKHSKFQVDLSHPIRYALDMGDFRLALLLSRHYRDQNVPELLRFHQDTFAYIVHNVDPAGIKELVFEFLQILIDRGYDINSPNYEQVTSNKSAWVSIINSPYYSDELLDLLMKNGANPNQHIVGRGCTWTPLYIAIYLNNLKAVQYLVGIGADLNTKLGPSVRNYRNTCNSPQTPLSYARALAWQGVDNNAIVDFLLQVKAPL